MNYIFPFAHTTNKTYYGQKFIHIVHMHMIQQVKYYSYHKRNSDKATEYLMQIKTASITGGTFQRERNANPFSMIFEQI